MKHVILYGTAACHLCEEAEELLIKAQQVIAFPIQIQKVDISESDDLMSRYGIRIPVVFKKEAGAEINWPFDFNALVDFLVAG